MVVSVKISCVENVENDNVMAGTKIGQSTGRWECECNFMIGRPFCIKTLEVRSRTINLPLAVKLCIRS